MGLLERDLVLQRIDRSARLLLAILLLSGGLHFFRLSEPRAVVFDEVHFGGFVNAYVQSGAYFFDVHPPHAKLLVAGVAALGGYRGEQDFGLIHLRISEVCPALLRAVPAAAGTLIPVLAFVLLLHLGARASPAQTPEALHRERGFAAYLVAVALLLWLAFLVDLPWLDALLEPAATRR